VHVLLPGRQEVQDTREERDLEPHGDRVDRALAQCLATGMHGTIQMHIAQLELPPIETSIACAPWSITVPPNPPGNRISGPRCKDPKMRLSGSLRLLSADRTCTF
jgi:hypothetical protein